MKPLIIPFFLFVCCLCHAQTNGKIVLTSKSTFQLNGTSNINKFECSPKQGFPEQKIDIYYTQSEDEIVFSNTEFDLEVENIECQHQQMTRDMQKTLKANQYPLINFQLLCITTADNNTPSAKARITIAGKSNDYHLTYDLKSYDNQHLIIYLNSKFNMKDFDIIPPTAMMGLIKVDEIITIELQLDVTLLAQN